MSGIEQIRTYPVEACIAFRKTSEAFGGLSNMAPSYIIRLNGLEILTSEALYQACRYPGHPEIQQQIIAQRSPMTAKEISKQYLYFTRSDWDSQRISIMRWAIQAKLLCNWYRFGALLKATGEKDIVEDSYKDTFWGAKLEGQQFVGVNALGRLLMQQREQYLLHEQARFLSLSPPKLDNFLLFAHPVQRIEMDVTEQLDGENTTMW